MPLLLMKALREGHEWPGEPSEIFRQKPHRSAANLSFKMHVALGPFSAGSPSAGSARALQELRPQAAATLLPLHSPIPCLPSSDSIKPLSPVSVCTANPFKGICIRPRPQFTFLWAMTERDSGWERTTAKSSSIKVFANNTLKLY